MRSLLPLEAVAEANQPNRLHYDIRVVWPDGTPSHYAAIDVPVERAIEVLEALVDELRAAASRGAATEPAA